MNKTRKLILFSGLALAFCSSQASASTLSLALVHVPDGGITVLLLGSSLVVLEGIRRKFKK